MREPPTREKASAPRTPAARATRAGGYSDALDLETYFLHDVSPEAAARGLGGGRDGAEVAYVEPCPFTRWPDVPTRVLAGQDDRSLPFAFQRRVARERLEVQCSRGSVGTSPHSASRTR